MNLNQLQTPHPLATAQNHGSLPTSRAARWSKTPAPGTLCLLGLLLICALATVACHESPGVSESPMASDPVPQFDDAIFTGTWISDGKYVQIVRVGEGFELRHTDHGTSDLLNALPFRVTRVNDTLFFEFQVQPEPGLPTLYWPCRVDVVDHSLQLYCFYIDELKTQHPEIEVHLKSLGESDKVLDETPDNVRDLCAKLAYDQKIFSLEETLKRPRPDIVARVQKRASSGDAEAQAELGQIYANAEYVARDYDLAEHWLRLAAEQGLPKAQYELAVLLPVIPSRQNRDNSESIFWLNSAVLKGYPKAYGELGSIYESGRGVPPDQAHALQLYREGAKQNDAASHYHLGEMYLSGELVQHDERIALNYFNAAVAIDPADGSSWEEIAAIRLTATDETLRDAGAALDAAQRAVAINPYYSQMKLLAQAQFANGEPATAAKSLREAMNASVGSDEDRALLARYEAAARQEGQLQ